ncbi:hypothetical protein PoB_000406200 [Plakobranchus ocellatus]|uniref:Uncharacterized protein n=1 Tax=Plakobranchus ocellatus TaxID=259542 RepID=A0AAV3Y5Z8_9GAST|nr:hypothetical protein PoB_000406200 [Plakobranchus ocellatus]
MSTNNQRSYFKCKRLDQITRYSTYLIPSAVVRVITISPRGCARKDSTAHADRVLGVKDNLQSEMEDEMLQLASEKAVLVVTICTELGDQKRTRDLHVPILRREI